MPGEMTMPGEFDARLNDVTSDAFKEREAEMCGEVKGSDKLFHRSPFCIVDNGPK